MVLGARVVPGTWCSVRTRGCTWYEVPGNLVAGVIACSWLAS